MRSCPIQECGRKFENDETMLEHVRRRHPNEYNNIRQDVTKSVIENEHLQQQALNKLPKLAKILSKEPKGGEVQRKSISKPKAIKPTNLSSIVSESRQSLVIDKSTIAARRPSIKKISMNETKEEKLPPILKEVKKLSTSILHEKKELPKKTEIEDPLYQTMPSFKETEKKSRPKSGRKLKKSVDKTSELKEPASATTLMRSTISNIGSAIQEDQKKNIGRPEKPKNKQILIKQKSEDSTPIDTKFDFGEKIIAVKYWSDSFFTVPSTSRVELLYLNNCNLSRIVLDELESLRELSATHNNLKDMEFLMYSKNLNLRVLHLDHNQISEVYTPPKLKEITLSFNLIESNSIMDTCFSLKKSPDLEEIDFSFNNIRKANSYKLKILSICPKLKKIDGLKTTKLDFEMAQEFITLESKQKGLIPLSTSFQDRPSTAVSDMRSDLSDSFVCSKTIDELEKEQKEYEKLISVTEEQLEVISQENQIINEELSILLSSNKAIESSWSSAALLQKLRKECEFLELLNIIQYADEEELSVMIAQKKEERGIENI